MTFVVGHSFGKTLKEMGDWAIADVVEHYAFLKVKDEFEAEAIRKARQDAGSR